MIELIIEIQDRETIKAIEALGEVGIETRVRNDEEVSWIGDSILQALYELSEVYDEMNEDIVSEIPKMVSELDWLLYEGGNAKLSLIDGLRREFFAEYVRRKVVERVEGKGAISFFKK